MLGKRKKGQDEGNLSDQCMICFGTLQISGGLAAAARLLLHASRKRECPERRWSTIRFVQSCQQRRHVRVNCPCLFVSSLRVAFDFTRCKSTSIACAEICRWTTHIPPRAKASSTALKGLHPAKQILESICECGVTQLEP